MTTSPKLEGYPVPQDDPLAAEHAAVAAWIEDAVASLGEHLYHKDVDLKSLPSGKKLLDAKPAASRSNPSRPG